MNVEMKWNHVSSCFNRCKSFQQASVMKNQNKFRKRGLTDKYLMTRTSSHCCINTVWKQIPVTFLCKICSIRRTHLNVRHHFIIWERSKRPVHPKMEWSHLLILMESLVKFHFWSLLTKRRCCSFSLDTGCFDPSRCSTRFPHTAAAFLFIGLHHRHFSM